MCHNAREALMLVLNPVSGIVRLFVIKNFPGGSNV
jgi:hypothetical protein